MLCELFPVLGCGSYDVLDLGSAKCNQGRRFGNAQRMRRRQGVNCAVLPGGFARSQPDVDVLGREWTFGWVKIEQVTVQNLTQRLEMD